VGEHPVSLAPVRGDVLERGRQSARHAFPVRRQLHGPAALRKSGQDSMSGTLTRKMWLGGKKRVSSTSIPSQDPNRLRCINRPRRRKMWTLISSSGHRHFLHLAARTRPQLSNGQKHSMIPYPTARILGISTVVPQERHARNGVGFEADPNGVPILLRGF
jgi:hypothetical protein